ncbi:hypothetical protein BJY00DRAFT_311068 [Aspergillus carlsbadensis]|nr:hypothetical protein BJY00DRAFT_311068 [Aspergillus carlsbadensis]
MANVRPPPHPSDEDCSAATPPGEEESGLEDDAENADRDINNLSKRLYKVEVHAFNRNRGALRVRAHGPTDLGALPATEMCWQGMTERSELYLRARHKVAPRVEHASFEPYLKRKYMQSLPDTNWAFRDDEDSTLLDVECYTYYESRACPGTVTLEGFGLECWEAIESQTIDVPVSDVPLPIIPLSKLLRRVDELRSGAVELGQDPDKDLCDLLEMLGDDGIRPYTARRAPGVTLNIPDLYEHLNRRDIMADFPQISSVTIQAYATEGYSLAGFILQMILSKELARRLERYDHVRAYAGFTEKILASLIIADRWFQNTTFILEDTEEDFSRIHSRKTDEGNFREARLEEIWDVLRMKLPMRSVVHERQVEGLLVFAENIKWPYLGEVRDRLRTAHKDFKGGLGINSFLHDWLTGVALPGRWFAFTIMSALIMCTPSLPDLGVAQSYDSGLSLPDCSYWRLRTTLGRILASLTGVVSLNGWIGPCPPVHVIGRVTNDKKPCHVNLRAESVLPSEYTTVIEFDKLSLDPHPEAPPRRPDEEAEAYIADIEDPSQWVVPDPPAQQVINCEIKRICLEALSLNPEGTAKAGSGKADTAPVDMGPEYLASIEFQIGDSTDTVTYTLATNPVFVSLLACYPEPHAAHQVHVRELPKYQTDIWTVENLKDCVPNDDSGDVIIINATGKCARVLAQAWCADRGKNAIVRAEGGPCFACALRAAGELGLGVGVLIWVCSG